MNNTLSRRTVLRASAALSASAMLAPFAGAQSNASGGSLPVRLGIASYTFRQFNMDQLIGYMKQLRTPYLNLKDVHLPMTPLGQVKAEADAYRAAGLQLTAAGTIYFLKEDDSDIRPKFEYLKAAGIPVTVCSPTHAVLPKLEPYVKEYNIKLAIHNHGPEDKEWPSPLDILKVVKDMDPRIGCCIDVGHCMRAGTDPVAAIHAVGPRLFDMHIKDLANGKLKESQVAVGEGLMPVRDLFKALIEIKYAGNVDLEYEIHGDDPMPGVVESFAYMRGVLAGMGYKG